MAAGTHKGYVCSCTTSYRQLYRECVCSCTRRYRQMYRRYVCTVPQDIDGAHLYTSYVCRTQGFMIVLERPLQDPILSQFSTSYLWPILVLFSIHVHYTHNMTTGSKTSKSSHFNVSTCECVQIYTYNTLDINHYILYRGTVNLIPEKHRSFAC